MNDEGGRPYEHSRKTKPNRRAHEQPERNATGATITPTTKPTTRATITKRKRTHSHPKRTQTATRTRGRKNNKATRFPKEREREASSIRQTITAIEMSHSIKPRDINDKNGRGRKITKLIVLAAVGLRPVNTEQQQQQQENIPPREPSKEPEKAKVCPPHTKATNSPTHQDTQQQRPKWSNQPAS